MADTMEASLQEHEKRIITMGRRMNQMQELMASQSEQTSAKIEVMRDQISQLSQKVQSFSDDITQKIMEAIGAYYRVDQKKTAAIEVPTTTATNSLSLTLFMDIPQPPSSTPNLYSTTSVLSSAENQNSNPPKIPQHLHNNFPTTCTTSPPIIFLPESAIRPMALAITNSTTTRASPQMFYMGIWPTYTNFFSMGSTNSPNPTSTVFPYVGVIPQNYPVHSSPYSASVQSMAPHATTYGPLSSIIPSNSLHNYSPGIPPHSSGPFYTTHRISQPFQLEDPSSKVTYVCTESIHDKEFHVANKVFDEIPNPMGYIATLDPKPLDDYNIAIGTLCANKKEFSIANKVFDKSPKQDGYIPTLNPKPPDEDSGTQFSKLVQNASVANCEMNKYQEQGELIEPYLESIISPLMFLVRSKTIELGVVSNEVLEDIKPLCIIIYSLVTVCRYKADIRFFPHQFSDLELAIVLLENCRLNTNAVTFLRQESIGDLEFVITLAEMRQRAAEMRKKLPQFIKVLFEILIQVLLDFEDENASETTNYSIGQECWDRLVMALGGNTIVLIVYELLSVYLAAPEWQEHYSTFIALAQIAKCCYKEMSKNLEPVVSMVLNSFQDPYPHLRWATVNAVGQLSTNLGPDLQVKNHHLVLPTLVAAMNDYQNSRVQTHVASAVLNFSVGCTQDTLTPYLNGDVGKLLVRLQNGKQMMQEGSARGLGIRVTQSVEGSDSWVDDPITRRVIRLKVSTEPKGENNMLWPLILPVKNHYYILVLPLVESHHMRAYARMDKRSECGIVVGGDGSLSSFFFELPSITRAFMVAHAIGDITTCKVLEPKVVVNVTLLVGGLLDSLTGNIGVSGISARAKPVAALAAASTTSSTSVSGAIASDGLKIGSLFLDKDALQTFITIAMPFGTPLDLNYSNIAAIKNNGISSSDFPPADRKQPAWKPYLYKGKQRILFTIQEMVNATTYDRNEIPDSIPISGQVNCRAELEGLPDVLFPLTGLDTSSIKAFCGLGAPLKGFYRLSMVSENEGAFLFKVHLMGSYKTLLTIEVCTVNKPLPRRKVVYFDRTPSIGTVMNTECSVDWKIIANGRDDSVNNLPSNMRDKKMLRGKNGVVPRF